VIIFTEKMPLLCTETNTIYVTWRGDEEELPEEDKIVSKHVTA
jgi:hypothetical protein